MYVAKAHFNHEGKPSTAVVGPENITRALGRLYRPNYGRVVIQDVKVTATEAGRFAVSVGVTLYRRGVKDGEEFRHVVELQEHSDSNGTAYGIYSDTRQDLNKPGPSVWAMETPPMFAKAGNETAIPELVQPPTAEEPVAAVAAPAATEEEVVVPAPEEKVEETVSSVPAAEEPVTVAEVEAAPAEVVTAPAAQPAAKPSFLDLARAAAPKTSVSTVAPARIEAKTEATKAKEKEEAERLAKEEEAKKSKKDDGKRKGKKDDKETEKKHDDGSKAAASARKDGNKVMNAAVVFYDVIVKGLPQDATDKSVAAMISPVVPVKKTNLKSQPDKKDSSIMRTFAFVLFDHDAIAASGSTVKDTIFKVQKEIRTKYGQQRIQVDEVREKFTHEESREKAAAAANSE
eukprot:CAMPEP_0176410098 /NCGR_PEP_ID=MMETSP0127-20121128/2867_1 /TAXON_ID=938130 /ORGANISM="Platyophrya macrostoma, Strain WH" /LENGTH=401 /DNA_ID=CAMNT_0017789555 /DNA_START=127 /DNA_END=1332 /DNA_ORIENTATION=+